MVESNKEHQSSFPQYLKILSRFSQASWSLPWAHLPTEENRNWDTEKTCTIYESSRNIIERNITNKKW